MVNQKPLQEKQKSLRSHEALTGLLVFLYIFIGMLVYGIVWQRHHLLDYLLLALALSLGTFLIIRIIFIRLIAQESKAPPDVLQSYSTTPEKPQDASEHKQVEEIKKLKEMERFRKDFLGNVSHELKTPIFNIQGYILTLLDGGMEDENVNRLYLKRAEKSINRLNNIVEDLDSIARLESGAFKLHLESFNLMKVIEEVVDDYEMTARQQNIKVSVDLTFPGPVQVKADRKRIVEVIGNLVNNSIKYGKRGGKTSIMVIETGKKVVVEISDNGIGIEEKDLPRIFERFFRVDKSRSRESGGTGLGLSIVKHIVQAHNQNITVKSRLGQGTTFTFSLDKV